MLVAVPKRVRYLWWLPTVALLLWPASRLHAQQDAPLPLSAYHQRLADALAQLDNGVDLETVQADIAAIKQV